MQHWLALNDSLGISMEKNSNIGAWVGIRDFGVRRDQVASLGCLLQLICKQGCLVVNHWKVTKTHIKLVFELMKERKIRKVTPIEEGDIIEMD